MKTKWSDWRTYMPTRFTRGKLSALQVTGILIGIAVIASLIAYVAHTPRSAHGGVSASSSFSSGNASSAPSTASAATGSSAADSSASSSAASAASSPSEKLAVSTAAGHFVIKTANIDLSSAHLSDSANTIEQITRDNGGYVQSVQSSTPSQGQSFESMTVRIPENQFQAVVTKIQSLGTVRSFTQSGQDVTSAHNNLQAQIAELQSEAQAYTSLFNKATSMSDMLQIQKSLSEVNSQITNLNQQLHQLNGSIQYATVNVSLYPSAVVMPKTQQPFWIAAVNSFHFMVRVGFDLLSALAWLLPWAVPIGVIWLIVHLVRKNRNRGTGI